MNYSSITYLQGEMTGEGVKREVGVWSWQETRPDPPHFFKREFGAWSWQDARPDPLHSLVKKHGVSDIAKATGLNRESLYKAVNGKTKPRWETVFKVMKALNFRLTTQVA